MKWRWPWSRHDEPAVTPEVRRAERRLEEARRKDEEVDSLAGRLRDSYAALLASSYRDRRP